MNLRQPGPTNVLIVGVGGQGVILISKVLARVCQLQGLDVKQSEVHGMAKRGGGVFSHVRFGQQVLSPTIASGEADILLAMEWAEGLRWLPFLEPHGTFITDTRKIVPPFSFRNRKPGAAIAYTTASVAEVSQRSGDSLALDATAIAAELGNPRAANTVLLGTLSAALPFPVADWQQVIAEAVPAQTEEVNLRAFACGREWVAAPPDPLDPVAVAAPAPQSVATCLEITANWCKGCGICTQMCPQRCLRLDEQQVARLTDPAACTACRICEWLCPDFAITLAVVREEAPDAG